MRETGQRATLMYGLVSARTFARGEGPTVWKVSLGAFPGRPATGGAENDLRMTFHTLDPHHTTGSSGGYETIDKRSTRRQISKCGKIGQRATLIYGLVSARTCAQGEGPAVWKVSLGALPGRPATGGAENDLRLTFHTLGPTQTPGGPGIDGGVHKR